MNSIFHARQFFINTEQILDILRAKKFDGFFTPFQPFFTGRLTSRRYNDPLKVIPEGSMVEYLTFQLGPRKAPKPLVSKKIFGAPKPEKGLNHYPIKRLSPLCMST